MSERSLLLAKRLKDVTIQCARLIMTMHRYERSQQSERKYTVVSIDPARVSLYSQTIIEEECSVQTIENSRVVVGRLDTVTWVIFLPFSVGLKDNSPRQLPSFHEISLLRRISSGRILSFPLYIPRNDWRSTTRKSTQWRMKNALVINCRVAIS